MHPLLARLKHVSDGATAVEYALMVALIAIVIFGSVTVLGLELTDLFADETLSTALEQ